MTIRQFGLFLLLVLGGVACVSAADQSASEVVEFSEAETRLWLTDQLAAVTGKTKFTYSFDKTGTYERGFSDRIEFLVDDLHDDGTKSASLQFLTGERNVPVPPAPNTDVNPVLKIYLQGDVYEMNRLTDQDGGARERWRYFQRRIKFALADTATVTPTSIEFGGKSYAGHEVRFAPYVNDPRRQLFEKFADKQYVVVVSDELPGYLYKIMTMVPNQDGGEALIQEVVQLTKIEAL
ncbi:MAG: hypothetical protein AAF384_17530 [Pseudomonadota bacterium]